MNYYFYRLGHCPALGLAEYEALTKSNDYQDNKKYLIGTKLLDAQSTGALVFGGLVIGEWDKEDFGADELKQKLLDYIGENKDRLKKLGLALPREYTKNALETAKKAGAKKVTVAKDVKPNFGNWKQTKNWIILFPFGDKYILGEISSFSNQEFWSKLDIKLPNNDMRRGIINLKLARSLLNLTDKSNIWDPFCGLGRSLIGGMDLKDEFMASDIDQTCLPGLVENYEKAERTWMENQSVLKNRKIGEPKEIYIADLVKTFSLNSQNLYQAQEIVDDPSWFQDCAIVTEGYLGRNFSKRPDVSEARNEWQKVYELWNSLFKGAKRLNIKEIVFCLPFYPNSGFQKDKPLLPEFLDELIEESDYRLVDLGKFDTIQYSRPNSNTGHLIVKVVMR